MFARIPFSIAARRNSATVPATYALVCLIFHAYIITEGVGKSMSFLNIVSALQYCICTAMCSKVLIASRAWSVLGHCSSLCRKSLRQSTLERGVYYGGKWMKFRYGIL